MLADLELPDHVSFVRATAGFTADTVPVGLLKAHRVAAGNWGLLRVIAGTVTFVLEETGESRELHPGDAQVIEPDTAHHVEPDADAVFVVEFHR
ncbi:MAG: DUF1971 domain-containing protein [Acidimicrobiales bacterium]